MARLSVLATTLAVAADEGRDRLPDSAAKQVATALAVLLVGAGVTAVFLAGDEPARAGHLDNGDVCAGAPDTHYYDVVALEIDVVYNNWGDHDPDGRVYVLEKNKDELLRQVEENPDEPAELARPLAIRGHIGDCVVMNFTNELPNPASIHVHGVAAEPGQGDDLGQNGNDLTQPNETRTYKVRIPDEEGMEGGHFLHSHGSPRFQTRHGMFGALVAEPKGTTWTAPDGSPMDSGIAAIIEDPDGPDFREFVIIYHDGIQLQDQNGSELPTVSPFGEYGPGSKGLNLRSEPFLDRFNFHENLHDNGSAPEEIDKSQGYGSYTYGDPSTFFMRSYVGDPTKHRLMNAGPGQHHVHHLHGGGIRWRNSPVSVQDTQFDAGFQKISPINRSRSERTDVQTLGPGESFNAEIEGGSGGVQQSVGDFLIHCHVVEHYVAGMWMFWRVHNTEQDGLAELEDRPDDAVEDEINSTALFHQFQAQGELPNGEDPTEANFRDWIEDQLPAQGVPGPDDASVWDWAVEDTDDGPLYLGEPETNITWPNYPADDPDRIPAGERPVLQFDPTNGRLAFPHLRPHAGKRPPFAPDHGGTPYLGDNVTDQRRDGLCPKGAPMRHYDTVATNATVEYNDDDVDTDGLIYTRAQDKDEILRGDKPARSLVLRANQGDCVDVSLTSQMPDDDHSKVNIHIHLVQFDIQASDGVIVGFNYEQSVRPAPAEDNQSTTENKKPTVTSVTSQTVGTDSTVLGVDRVEPFLDAEDSPKIGSHVGVGLTEPSLEQATVTDVDATAKTITVDEALDQDHVNQFVGYEVVNYRWHPDVNLGMVYWHDHVDGLKTWRHGLFGGLVVEPSDSQYCDPHRDASEQTTCGSDDQVTDHTVDVVDEKDPGNETDTFREYVVQVQDRSLPDDLASFNLRASPFDNRDNTANVLANDSNGPPATDLWEAYPGDESKIRLLYAGQSTSRAVATFGIDGHTFPREQFNPGSRQMTAQSFGISDQFNLRLKCGAGGCQNLTGDYMYQLTEPDNFRRGAWGIFRVHEPGTSDLVELPNNENPEAGSMPDRAPDRTFDLVAKEINTAINVRENLYEKFEMFVPQSKVDAWQDDPTKPEPLVMRANEGDLIEVEITNDIGEPITLSPDKVAADPASGGGVPIGENPVDRIQIADDETKTFRWLANQEGVGYITSYGQPADHALQGLYGAIVVEPEDATFTNETGAAADVTLGDGTSVREHVILYQDNAPEFQASVMPYDHVPDEFGLVNYRTEHWEDRMDDNLEEGEPTPPEILSSSDFGEPETPIVTVGQDQTLRLIGVKGAGDQLQVHHVGGHWWKRDPDMNGSQLVSFETLGQGETSDAWIENPGPGGPGDYYYGSERIPFMETGAWGLVRVK